LPIWEEEEKNKFVNRLSFKARPKGATSRKELEIIDFFALSDPAASFPKHTQKKTLSQKQKILSVQGKQFQTLGSEHCPLNFLAQKTYPGSKSATKGWRRRKYQKDNRSTKSPVNMIAADDNVLLLKTSPFKVAQETESQQHFFFSKQEEK